jgi:hypothetical protein
MHLSSSLPLSLSLARVRARARSLSPSLSQGPEAVKVMQRLAPKHDFKSMGFGVAANFQVCVYVYIN